MTYITVSRVVRRLTGLGARLLALISPPTNEEPWANGGDKHDRLLGALAKKALTEEKTVNDLKAFKEFENDEIRAIKVEAVLAESAVFATGVAEEAAYRRQVNDTDWWPTTTIVCWLLLTAGGIDITVLTLYRLGYSWGGDNWGDRLSILGLPVLFSLFLVGVIRRSTRTAALLVTIGMLGCFAGYKFYFDGRSFVEGIVAVVFVLVMSFTILAASMAPLEELKRTLLTAFKEWEKALYENGVRPALAKLANSLMKERYDTTLHYQTEFLSRSSIGDEFHQQMPVGDQIENLMKTGRNGSLAIAGPRGAGKSDLMAAFCRGTYNASAKRRDLVVSTSAPVVYQAAEFMLDLHRELCEAVIDYVQTYNRAAAKLVNKRRRKINKLKQLRRKGRVLTDWSEVLLRAYIRTDEIRYLLTVGGELSGRLGLGRSHASSKKTFSKAEQPMTHPQIVNRLRKDLEYFADRLALLGAEEGTHPRLIVAIDELDRIQSAERAVQFVNEIKAIYIVSNCYFLISVSEDALQEFELAGIGVRTAIDSAFDEVLWVDYMDFDFAKSLLNNYVVGLSEQYLAFAYVRSGGLARQLIRCARELITWPKGMGASISDVACTQASVDLQRVSTAIKGSLTKVSNRSAVAALVRILDDHPSNSIDHSVLTSYTRRLIECDIGDDRDARDLRDTMAAQSLYLATLTRIFSSDLGKGRMEKATNSAVPGASFNALARVRRYLGVNPQAALELLTDFRSHWDMPRVALGADPPKRVGLRFLSPGGLRHRRRR